MPSRLEALEVPPKACSLSDAPMGCPLKILQICPCEQRHSLLERGFVTGQVVKKGIDAGNGFVVHIRNERVTLAADLAARITVERVEEGAV